MAHRLSTELKQAAKAAKAEPTANNWRKLAAAINEACGYLDRMADRQSAGGLAARGNSGRPKGPPFDLETARKMLADGASQTAIAAKLGVSQMTVSRNLAADK